MVQSFKVNGYLVGLTGKVSSHTRKEKYTMENGGTIRLMALVSTLIAMGLGMKVIGIKTCNRAEALRVGQMAQNLLDSISKAGKME